MLRCRCFLYDAALIIDTVETTAAAAITAMQQSSSSSSFTSSIAKRPIMTSSGTSATNMQIFYFVQWLQVLF